MKLKNSKIFLFFSGLLWLSPWLAFAQDPNTNCKNFQSQFDGAFNWVNLSHYCTAGGLASYLIQVLLAFSGTVTILFLMVGGFWYLTSAGNEEQAEKGRKVLTNSIIGLVVIMLAFAIVRIVGSTLTAGK